MKYRYLKDNLHYFLSTPLFKVLYVIAIIIPLSVMYGNKMSMPDLTYIGLFCSLIENPSFVLYSLFFIPLVASTSIYLRFEKNRFHILRLKNKKNYLKTLLGQVLSVNSFLFLVLVMTTMIELNLFGTDFSISNYSDYNVSNLFYLIYSLFRLHFISQLFIILSICFFKILNPTVTIVMNIVTYLLVYMQGNFITFESILKKSMSFWVGKYIMTDTYDSFLQEFQFTILFLVLFLFGTIVIVCLTPKCIKEVGQ